MPEGLDDLRFLDSRRVRAALIDAGLLVALYIVLGIVVGRFETWQGFAFLWAAITYFFVLEASGGQTLGKRYYAIQVMTREGTVPSLNSIATRNTIRIIEEPVLALIVMACSRKRRQRIGDLFASTTVGRAGFLAPRGFSPRLAIYPAIWAATGAVLLLGT